MKIKIRISDNVLEEEDWPVFELTLGELEVTETKILQPGVYGRGFTGMPIERLLELLHFDPTGQHPEISYDIWDPDQEQWVIKYRAHELDHYSLEDRP